MRRIYFDNAATTQVDPLVVQEMLPYLTENYGNPSSIHSFGTEAHCAIEAARAKVAALVGGKPDEIIFTGGGTEADNIAILGTAYRKENKGCHIITSAIEHPAVLNTCKYLESHGFEVTYVPVDSEGIVNPEDVRKSIKPTTRLVTVMHSNNEIGTIQPLEEIGKIAKEAGVLLHTDSVQSAGKMRLNAESIGASMMTLSAHKIYGPKGIGALYIRKGTKLEPLIHGGGHERGLRPSTENVHGIVGFGKAAELALGRMDEDVPKITKMRDMMIDGALSSIKDAYLTGHRTKRLPNSASFRFRFIEGESLMLHLDMLGIAASTGSACSSKSLKASHVLLALGLPQEEVHGSLRCSLGRTNTEDEVDYFVKELPAIVEKLRKMSPLAR